jgi:hypothetical protein
MDVLKLERILSKRILLQEEELFKKNSQHNFSMYIEESEEILKNLISVNNINVRVPFAKFKVNSYNPTPRILSIHDGKDRKGKTPCEGKKFKYRGLTLIEGLWFITYYPEVLQDHSLDLLETTYSIECVPTLYYWGNTVNLSAICPDVSDSMCGAPYVTNERAV